MFILIIYHPYLCRLCANTQYLHACQGNASSRWPLPVWPLTISDLTLSSAASVSEVTKSKWRDDSIPTEERKRSGERLSTRTWKVLPGEERREGKRGEERDMFTRSRRVNDGSTNQNQCKSLHANILLIKEIYILMILHPVSEWLFPHPAPLGGPALFLIRLLVVTLSPRTVTQVSGEFLGGGLGSNFPNHS